MRKRQESPTGRFHVSQPALQDLPPANAFHRKLRSLLGCEEARSKQEPPIIDFDAIERRLLRLPEVRASARRMGYEIHDWTWALEQLKAGRKVRCNAMLKYGEHLELSRGCIWFVREGQTDSNERWVPELCDLEALDWEIVA